MSKPILPTSTLRTHDIAASPRRLTVRPRAWPARLRFPGLLHPGRLPVDPAGPIEDALASVRTLLGTDDPVPADAGRLASLHAEMAGHSRALISLLEHRYTRGRGLSSQQRRLVSRAGERSRRSVPIVPDTAAVIELVKLAEMVQDLAMLAGQSRRVRPSTTWHRVAGGTR